MERVYNGYLFFVNPDFRSIQDQKKFMHEAYNSVDLSLSEDRVSLDLDWRNNGFVKRLNVIGKLVGNNSFQAKVYDQGNEIDEEVYFTVFPNGSRMMVSGEWTDGAGQWSMIGEFNAKSV